MHGPAAAADRRQRRTCYLIAFLDDATRLCPFAAFARAENTTAFLPVFKQALIRRGLPQRLYVVGWPVIQSATGIDEQTYRSLKRDSANGTEPDAPR